MSKLRRTLQSWQGARILYGQSAQPSSLTYDHHHRREPFFRKPLGTQLPGDRPGRGERLCTEVSCYVLHSTTPSIPVNSESVFVSNRDPKFLRLSRGPAIDSDRPRLQFSSSFPLMSHVPATDYPDSDTLRSVIEHVFLPPRLPQAGPSEETEHKTNGALCNSLVEAARDFLQIVPSSQRPLWKQMIKMMELARRAAIVPFEEADLHHVFSDMTAGGMFI